MGQFVGPRYRLRGRAHADWGSLVVVFQNGRPDRVVPPGGRFFRGFRAPTFGELEVCDVNIDIVDVTQVIRSVPTRDEFVVESITVRAQTKLNPAGGYRAFSRFLQVNGPRFGDALIERLRQDIDQRIRNSFRAVDHVDVFGHPLAHLGPGENMETIGDDGLLLLTSLAITDVQWSEAFLRLQQQNVMAEVARADAEIDRIKATELQLTEGAAAAARVAAFTEVAAQLGVPVAALTNPELIQLPQERAHALLMQMLDPANRGAAMRNPEVMNALMQASGLGALPFGNVHRQPANVVNASPDTPAPTSLPASHAYDTRNIAADYTVDRRALRVWSSASPGAETNIVGLGAASAHGRAAIVALGSSTEPVVTPAVQQSLLQLYKVTSIDVIALSAGLPNIVALNWFDRLRTLFPGQAGDLHAGVNVAETSPGFEVLEVLVQGPIRKARDFVAAMNDIQNPHVSALAAVMPYADVTIKLDDRAAA